MSRILLRILQLFFLVALQGALLFLCAGSLAWTAAWWYVGLYLGMLIAASLIMIPHRKEVIEERSRGTQGGKGWDKVLTLLMAIPTLGLLAVAGFDQRWGWSVPLPAWLRLAGGGLFLLGYLLVLWAMFANRYFSQVVRIQAERGHTAVTDGPYRIIRHPGYLGMTTSLLGAVFLLDTTYGLACFAVYLVLIVARTALEDRTLQAELPGYLEFTRRTRYRLIPGVW